MDGNSSLWLLAFADVCSWRAAREGVVDLMGGAMSDIELYPRQDAKHAKRVSCLCFPNLASFAPLRETRFVRSPEC